MNYQDCEEMKRHLEEGEVALWYSKKYREYGLPILDGGTSVQLIRFCPWCGGALPPSLRHIWHKRIRQMGLEPRVDALPTKFTTDAWWREEPMTIHYYLMKIALQEILDLARNLLPPQVIADADDLIRHHEFGIALELLCSALDDDQIRIPASLFDAMVRASDAMEMKAGDTYGPLSVLVVR